MLVVMNYDFEVAMVEVVNVIVINHDNRSCKGNLMPDNEEVKVQKVGIQVLFGDRIDVFIINPLI